MNLTIGSAGGITGLSWMPLFASLLSAIVALVALWLSLRTTRQRVLGGPLMSIGQNWLEQLREDLSEFLCIGERFFPIEIKHALIPEQQDSDLRRLRHLTHRLRILLGREKATRIKLGDLISDYAKRPSPELETAIEAAAQDVFRERWDQLKRGWIF